MVKTTVGQKIRILELASELAIESGDPDYVYELFDNFLLRVLTDDEVFLEMIEMEGNDETTVTCDNPMTEEEIDEMTDEE